MDIKLGIIVMAGYAFYFAVRIIFRRRFNVILCVFMVFQLASMAARAVELRQFPIVSVADTLALLSFILMVFYFLMNVGYSVKEARFPDVFFGLAALFILCAGVVLYLFSGEIVVRDELKTVLLPMHVIPAMLGYAFFTAGFAGAAANIAGTVYGKEWAGKIGSFSFRANIAGNIFFGIGALVIGSIWSRVAWGSFWTWDAKETFSLATFLVYSIYLFLGLRKKLDGLKLSFVCVACYCLLLFTYVGVTYFMQGRHSYR